MLIMQCIFMREGCKEAQGGGKGEGGRLAGREKDLTARNALPADWPPPHSSPPRSQPSLWGSNCRAPSHFFGEGLNDGNGR